MLFNTYCLIKFRFDAAENEPAKILQNFANPNQARGPGGQPRGPDAGLAEPGPAGKTAVARRNLRRLDDRVVRF